MDLMRINFIFYIYFLHCEAYVNNSHRSRAHLQTLIQELPGRAIMLVEPIGSIPLQKFILHATYFQTYIMHDRYIL
jgi:hypothetical protein